MNIAHTLQMYNYQFSSQTPWLPSMRRRKRSGVYNLLIRHYHHWSKVVWWLGFCGLTATAGVRFPVWEVFLLCCYSFFSTTLHEQLHWLVLVVFLHLIRRQCVVRKSRRQALASWTCRLLDLRLDFILFRHIYHELRHVFNIYSVLQCICCSKQLNNSESLEVANRENKVEAHGVPVLLIDKSTTAWSWTDFLISTIEILQNKHVNNIEEISKTYQVYVEINKYEIQLLIWHRKYCFCQILDV